MQSQVVTLVGLKVIGEVNFCTSIMIIQSIVQNYQFFTASHFEMQTHSFNTLFGIYESGMNFVTIQAGVRTSPRYGEITKYAALSMQSHVVIRVSPKEYIEKQIPHSDFTAGSCFANRNDHALINLLPNGTYKTLTRLYFHPLTLLHYAN
jgi:hypothetical protein